MGENIRFRLSMLHHAGGRLCRPFCVVGRGGRKKHRVVTSPTARAALGRLNMCGRGARANEVCEALPRGPFQGCRQNPPTLSSGSREKVSCFSTRPRSFYFVSGWHEERSEANSPLPYSFLDYRYFTTKGD